MNVGLLIKKRESRSRGMEIVYWHVKRSNNKYIIQIYFINFFQIHALHYKMEILLQENKKKSAG